MTNLAKKNAVLVHALSSAMRSTGNGLGAVPGLLKKVIAEESWREFTTPLGHPVKHRRFVDFVTAKSPEGLEADVSLVKRICDSDTEAADLLDQALQNLAGHPPTGNNVPNRPEGNTQAKALRRLRKDKPELHAEVLAGRLTAHAAMVQAGFRPKTISVPVSRPDSVAAALRKHMTPEQLAQLRALLDEQEQEQAAVVCDHEEVQL